MVGQPRGIRHAGSLIGSKQYPAPTSVGGFYISNKNKESDVTPKEYVKLAMRTKNDLGMKGNTVHASLLLTSESGEVASEVKRFFAYNKSLDIAHIKEELGDVLWGIALMCDTLGIELEDVMQSNILKLEARYPDLCFKEEHALNRDLAAEKAAMRAV